MLKRMAKYCVIVIIMFLIMPAAQSGQIPIANNSFEIPAIDPNGFPAIPVAPLWIEADLDTEYSTNTGVFRNPDPNSTYDHIVNADGNQLAFLGSQSGNGFLQDPNAAYQTGKSYRLTVEVCPSVRLPPSGPDPNNKLVLSLYYVNDANSVDIQTSPVLSTELTINVLKTFSVTMPAVQSGDAWVGKNIGIAIRADGLPGGYWDLDNVRLTEFQTMPDFTGDSFVNLQDFTVMASEWLSCADVTADVTGDGCVDTEDLLILAEYWLGYV